MIQDGFMYVSVLVALAAVMVFIEKKFGKTKFMKFIPGIVLIYIGAALMQTFGLFESNESTEAAYSNVRWALLPAMLFLMLLKCDIRVVIKLGPKMLGSFAVAVFSIACGFVLVYALLQSFYVEDTWKAFGALAGSWTGGSANMVALQSILDVPETIFGYVLMMDTINYAVWVMFMFWLVPFADRFNKWTKADTSFTNTINLNTDNITDDQGAKFEHILYLLGIGLLVSSLSSFFGNQLPVIGDIINGTTWTIVIASVLGLILALTPLSRIPGTFDVSNVMLYIVVALIASHSDFSDIAQAPIYIISGFLIMGVHLIIMLIFTSVALK